MRKNLFFGLALVFILSAGVASAQGFFYNKEMTQPAGTPIFISSDLEGVRSYFISGTQQLVVSLGNDQITPIEFKVALGHAMRTTKLLPGENPHGVGSPVWLALARAVKEFNSKTPALSCVLSWGAGDVYSLFFSNKSALYETGLVDAEGYPSEYAKYMGARLVF